MSKLDATDYAILRELQRDGHLTIKEIAPLVNLTPTPVYERVKRLERDGVIRKYVAVLDPDKLAAGFVVYCHVKLARINEQIALDFERQVGGLSHVVECYNISGEFDYLLKIQVRDMSAYRTFLLQELGRIEGVSDVRSTFVMSACKSEVGYQIPEEAGR